MLSYKGHHSLSLDPGSASFLCLLTPFLSDSQHLFFDLRIVLQYVIQVSFGQHEHITVAATSEKIHFIQFLSRNTYLC